MAPKPTPRLVVRKPTAPVIPPELAQRLARVRKEAEAAGREAEAERVAISAVVHGVQSRSGESRAFDTSTRHTGMILPRLYAMSMRMAPWPTLPMPGFDHSHHAGKPFRPRLHTRREVREALIAQTLLQPAKGLTR
jgi:alkanesulfonate monooxygenase SsuD/methylene tetrahydromethanopterin reductase-like flavin-dependent oxidoreductase (luciferase family)